MSNEPEALSGGSGIKAFLSRLLALLTHRWGWKLVALVCAIALWGGLILQDETLTRERVFNDVTISVTGSDTLTRSGLVVVSGLENLATVRLRADVPQRVYNTVTASNFNVRVDLSRIREAGTQVLNVLTTSSSVYGTVTDVSVTQITVEVEPYLSRSRIPVRLAVIGGVPEGFYAAPPSVDPPYVTVSGPRSLVTDVVRCVAEYDVSALEARAGTERTGVPYTLYNRNNEPIQSDLIRVSMETVTLDSLVVEQTLYPQKTILLSTIGLVSGQPASGYAVASVTVQPERVLLAGAEDLISETSFAYLAGAVDISGASQSMTRAIQIARPEDAVYLSADIAYVTVEIKKIGGTP